MKRKKNQEDSDNFELENVSNNGIMLSDLENINAQNNVGSLGAGLQVQQRNDGNGRAGNRRAQPEELTRAAGSAAAGHSHASPSRDLRCGPRRSSTSTSFPDNHHVRQHPDFENANPPKKIVDDGDQSAQKLSQVEHALWRMADARHLKEIKNRHIGYCSSLVKIINFLIITSIINKIPHGPKWNNKNIYVLFLAIPWPQMIKIPSKKKQKQTEKIKKPKITGVDKQKSKRTFFNYSEADLQKALELVKNVSAIAAACKQCRVPRTTLRNKIRGKVPETAGRVGPESVLGRSIKDKLEEWLLGNSRMGFPIKKDFLIHSVKRLVEAEGLKNPFTNNVLGRKWFYGFLKRRPRVGQKRAEHLSDKWIEVMEAKEEEEKAEKERKRLIQLERQEKREQEKVRREKEKEKKQRLKEEKLEEKAKKN
ncbi:hypothetical protein EVAR_4664_1 [Eumeta japonica]|uniref:HTH CENPB-type domain-containing protein n=1 Tax=Eumeta variegata TaxID=151549 RepID=A0A4C1YCM4_EUMVA|nr:hypothetical protein EVAR_4664_1 [Eumeta japonica]